MVKTDYRRALSRLRDALSRVSLRLKRQLALTSERRERGQTLMEFAFIVPIMLIFLLITVDFGLAMDRRIVMQNAVREGARMGATGATPADIQSRVANDLGITDPAKIAKITTCYVDANNDTKVGNVGDNVHVEVDLAYRFTTGGTEILTAFGAPPVQIPMSPSADMRLEQTVPGTPKC